MNIVIYLTRKMIRMKCPICKGTGKIEKPFHSYITKRIMARLLKKEGYSIRQIMKFLDYKSPQSIQGLLKKETPL